MRDPYVHFRYHDAVNALIGRHRWRYEVIKLSDVPEMIKSLAPKGFDQFACRRIKTLDSWKAVDLTSMRPEVVPNDP